jgi:K+-dependent Na+/Ca+ exchanger-like protein
MLIGYVLLIVLSFYIMSKVVDEYFIESLDEISDSMGLSPSVAGATLMAMGTSAPELSTALISMFLASSSPATGIGTIVGSAIFQILVVVGFAAIIKTTYLDWKPVVRDCTFYGFTILLLVYFIQDGVFTIYESGTLLFVYLLYLGFLFFWAKKIDKDNTYDPIDVVDDTLDATKKAPTTLIKILNLITRPFDIIIDLLPDPKKSLFNRYFIFIMSLFLIGFLSYLLVFAAENLAILLNIHPAIIALTILAGGSSIPELIGSAIVSRQGRGDMAISNALGSNVFDVLVSLGLPVFLYNVMNGDLTDLGGENITSSVILLFFTLFAVLAMLAFKKFKATKIFGYILILLYIVYVIIAYTGLL